MKYVALPRRSFQEVFIMDSNEKVFGVLAYIGILFIVPLAAGKTEFSKFHANQGIVLFIAELVLGIVAGVLSAIPFIGFIGGILSAAVSVASLVFMIMGIVAAAQGEMKPLPLIGGIKIVK